MRKSFFLLLFILCGFILRAQEKEKSGITDFGMQIRGSYGRQWNGDTTASGFSGQYCNLVINGELSERVSFRYLQRLNKMTPVENSLFGSVDWAFLTWQANPALSFSAGKMVMAVGGFEYFAAPVDVYYYSYFTGNIGCFQFGSSAQWNGSEGRNTFTAQVTNSSFTSRSFEGLYAYNLLWSANFSPIRLRYSFNTLEYTRNHYVYYLALGNQYESGRVTLSYDFIHRNPQGSIDWLRNYSMIGRMVYKAPGWNLFAKLTYDRNKNFTGNDSGSLSHYDLLVPAGTNHAYIGGGAEYFPLPASDRLRVHAFVVNRRTDISRIEYNVGLTWRPDFLRIKI